MKKLIFVILIVLFASPVWAAIYYVDSSITDTNVASATPDFTTYNPATFSTATGSDSVYKTIADVNLKTFSPGDSVLFRKGQTWREMLSPHDSGTGGNQITYGSFGSGNIPQILGSNQVTTWTDTSVTADSWSDAFTGGSGYIEAREGWQANTYRVDNGGALNGYVALANDRIEDSSGYTEGTMVYNLAQDVPSDDIYYVQADVWLSSNTYITPGPIIRGAIGTSNTLTGYYCYIQTSDGNLVLRRYNNGASTYLIETASGFTFDSPTTLRMEVSGTGASVYVIVKVGGVIKLNYEDTSADRITTKGLGGIHTSHGSGQTAYIDNFIVSTDAITLPAGSWKALCVAEPTQVWVIGTGGTVTHGKKETVITNVNAEYDWYWDSTTRYLVMYAATTPDTRYTSVEASARSSVIHSSWVDYITISGMELAYGSYYGVRVTDQNGWVVDGCTVHHIGVIDSSEAEGIHQRSGVGLHVKNSTIHNCGNHGVAALVDSAGTISGLIIENNIFYDNYHSDIDFQNISGTFSSATVRYNYLYNTSSFDYAGYSNGGIYILGEFGNPISGVQVYYNIIYQKTGTAIVIRDLVVSPVLYNNTIYGALAGSSQYAGGIDIFSLGTYDPSGVVVKNNICMDTRNVCFRVEKLVSVSSVNNNLWYQSAGGGAVYTQIVSTDYLVGDQAAYKSATGFDTNGKWQNPIFTSTSTPNFRLLGSSPAINTAANVGLTVDHIGTVVPKGVGYDMGAYEYIPMTFTVGSGSQTVTVGTGSQTFTLQ